MKPRWNTSLILGTLVIAAVAYIGSLYVNRYRLVDDGRKRIDTITGRVWVLRSAVVFDETKAMELVSDYRNKNPEFKDKSDSELVEILRDFNTSRQLSSNAPLYSMRTETFWEVVKE